MPKPKKDDEELEAEQFIKNLIRNKKIVQVVEKKTISVVKPDLSKKEKDKEYFIALMEKTWDAYDDLKK